MLQTARLLARLLPQSKDEACKVHVKMLDWSGVTVECVRHPGGPVSTVFGASASKTSFPSCEWLGLEQAAARVARSAIV